MGGSEIADGFDTDQFYFSLDEVEKCYKDCFKFNTPDTYRIDLRGKEQSKAVYSQQKPSCWQDILCILKFIFTIYAVSTIFT
jgi:hypothetical protein